MKILEAIRFLREYIPLVRECVSGLSRAIERIEKRRFPVVTRGEGVSKLGKAREILGSIKGWEGIGRIGEVLELIESAWIDLSPSIDYLVARAFGFEKKARELFERGDYAGSLRCLGSALGLLRYAKSISVKTGVDSSLIDKHMVVVRESIDNTVKAYWAKRLSDEIMVVNSIVREGNRLVNERKWSSALEKYDEALEKLNKCLEIARRYRLDSIVKKILEAQVKLHVAHVNCLLSKARVLLEETASYREKEDLVNARRYLGEALEAIEEARDYHKRYGLYRLRDVIDKVYRDYVRENLLVEYLNAVLESRTAREYYDRGDLYLAKTRYESVLTILEGVIRDAETYGFTDIVYRASSDARRFESFIRQISEMIEKPIVISKPVIEPPSIELPAATSIEQAGVEEKPSKPFSEKPIICTPGRLIGRGGYASVYLCSDRPDTVVKIYFQEILGSKTVAFDRRALEKIMSVFENEIEKTRRLSIPGHKNILLVKDYGGQPYPWIAMDYMEGGSLRDRIKTGRLGWREAVEIMYSVADALAYAHDMGVFHLDLKPENILFTRDGVPKVSDWGQARTYIEAYTSRLPGFTLAYTAPEILDPRYGSIRSETDSFEYGIVFYEVLTGRHPFMHGSILEIERNILEYSPKPPHNIYNDIPRELSDIVMECLVKDVDKRISVREVRRRLRRFIEEELG